MSAVGATKPNLAPSTSGAHQSSSLSTWMRSWFSIADTPGRMRLVRAVCVAGALTFLIGTTLGISRQGSALRHARDHATQSVRIGTIRTELVKADAIATNSFLVGGLEAPGTRDAFSTALARATREITTASAHDRSDAKTLSDVSATLNTYVNSMEAARTNNRQLLPVGTSYLKDASNLLRVDVLPKLQDLANANARRIEADYLAATNAHAAALLCLVVALIPLLGAMLWLLSVTRRLINVGYLAATVVIGLSGSIALLAMQSEQSDANLAHDDAYATVITSVQARANAFDAKSAESLTLISRGTGESYEQSFRKLASDAVVQLEARSSQGRASLDSGFTAFRAYLNEHDKIRELDDVQGDWEGAVARATKTSAGSSNDLFTQFDRSNSGLISDSAKSFNTTLNDASSSARWLGGFTAVAGLIALALCFVAMTPRLREYR